MDLGLRDKIAFVAGASKGLGYAVAEELAREGARVAICARDRETLQESAARIATSTGGEVRAYALDLTRPGMVEQTVAEIGAVWGPPQILVANAGGAPAGRFDDLDDARWQEAWELNFLSTVRMIRAVLPGMRAAHWGRIITITSMSVKQPVDNLLLSNAVRPGVVGLVRDLATQLAAEGITINNVGPGWTKTERVMHIVKTRAAAAGTDTTTAEASITASIPAGRLGDPAEFAAMVAFLASERAAYITGQTVLVDGGWYRGTL